MIRSLKYLCKKNNCQDNLENDLKIIETFGTARTTNLPIPIKKILLACTEIPPEAHMQITSAFQRFTDEAISKTVNLPENTNLEEIASIYTQAYDLGLKGISVYVDKSRNFQPKPLTRSLTTEIQNNPLYFQDIIYGEITVPSSFQSLLYAPIMQRLKNIHQNGIDYLIDPKRSATRFEHSLGVMHLVSLLNGSVEEQVVALLHDISHTCFSHFIDVIFDNKEQNYHEKIRRDFLNRSELKSILMNLKIDLSRIEQNDFFPIVKAKSVDLSADRLDYFLRDSVHMNLISVAEARSVINNLVVIDHIIHCVDEDTARFIFEKFIALNQDVYFNEKFEGAALVFKFIIKQLFKEKFLKETDFMESEAGIIQKIKQSKYRKLFLNINPNISVEKRHCAYDVFSMSRKLRYIDPRIAACGGKRLTDIRPDTKKRLNEYLSLPSRVYYHIPILSEYNFECGEHDVILTSPAKLPSKAV